MDRFFYDDILGNLGCVHTFI